MRPAGVPNRTPEPVDARSATGVASWMRTPSSSATRFNPHARRAGSTMAQWSRFQTPARIDGEFELGPDLVPIQEDAVETAGPPVVGGLAEPVDLMRFGGDADLPAGHPVALDAVARDRLGQATEALAAHRFDPVDLVGEPATGRSRVRGSAWHRRTRRFARWRRTRSCRVRPGRRRARDPLPWPGSPSTGRCIRRPRSRGRPSRGRRAGNRETVHPADPARTGSARRRRSSRGLARC